MPGIDTYKKLGRWLCSAAYRDARGLQRAIGVHEFQALFGGLDQLCPAWIELLSGGFRYKQFCTLSGGTSKGAKWLHLGEVVLPGVASIDGVGEVRALELLLYWEIGERFAYMLQDYYSDDQRSPT